MKNTLAISPTALFFATCLLLIVLLESASCQKVGYTITTNTISENNKAPIYHIAAALPKIQKKTADSTAANRINEVIDYYIKSQIEQFKTDITLSRQLAPNDQPNTLAGELEIKTNIGLQHERLFSVNISTLYHNTAAAYPQYIEQFYTFDAQSGEALTLNRLFQTEPNYLAVIAAFVEPIIKDKQQANQITPDTLLIKEATAPLLQNYSNFLLFPNHISFYFPYYKINPQRQPDVWVNVPYSVVRPYLLKKYRWN